jgi:HlyD family secretion protein
MDECTRVRRPGGVWLLVLAAALAVGGCTSDDEPGEDATATPTAVATLGPIGASGEVKASARVVPVHHVTLAFPEGGTLDTIEVAEGDFVKTGDVLARLDGTQSAAAVLLAQADLRAAEAALAEVTADADQSVAQDATAAAQARVRAAVDAAQALVDQASARLELASVQADRTVLRAPFDGRIAAVEAGPSEVVAAGAPIVQLADDSAWLIETDDLTELDVGRIAVGDEAAITVEAFPDLELGGEVLSISPVGETRLGDVVFTVVVRPLETDDRLRWNMSAEVTISPSS